jgi:hypothetical protein
MHERLRRVLVRVYPRAWRDRYGVEFTTLLEDSGGGWTEATDVMRAGLAMRATTTNLRITFGFALAGLALAGADRSAHAPPLPVRSGG